VFLSFLWRGLGDSCRFCGEETWLFASGPKCRITVCHACWDALQALGLVRESIPDGMEAEHGRR